MNWYEVLLLNVFKTLLGKCWPETGIVFLGMLKEGFKIPRFPVKVHIRSDWLSFSLIEVLLGVCGSSGGGSGSGGGHGIYSVVAVVVATVLVKWKLQFWCWYHILHSLRFSFRGLYSGGNLRFRTEMYIIWTQGCYILSPNSNPADFNVYSSFYSTLLLLLAWHERVYSVLSLEKVLCIPWLAP
jgi:hypothetical protein